MARPLKNNADYFSHDSQMRNDVKIKAVRRKYGHIGYSVWNMLLEIITDSENFKYEYNDLNIELLSGDFDIEPQLLKEIINYFIHLELVQTSEDNIYIQKLIDRFDGLLRKRKRDRERDIADENPQSKVKESKVNKSKEKEIKVNYTVHDFEKFFDDNGYKKSEGQKAYYYYESNNFRDKMGTPVTDNNWKSVVSKWFKSEIRKTEEDFEPEKTEYIEYTLKNAPNVNRIFRKTPEQFEKELAVYGEENIVIRRKNIGNGN